MANYRDIIVFDFETTGQNPYKCQPTQIAAVAIHARKLELQPNGVFESKIRCIVDDEKAVEAGFDPIEEKALEVTRKTREEISKGPKPKTVWNKFDKFVGKFNWKGTSWTAPIASGFNINGYDMPIVNRMCKEYGPWNEKKNQQTLFNPIFTMDLMQHIYCWFENNTDCKGYSMDYMRDYFGLPKDNAHDALQDVKDTANILIKFLKMQRNMSKKITFEKAFGSGDLYVK
jgi:DNA polymerase III epsilon subunit-like protein